MEQNDHITVFAPPLYLSGSPLLILYNPTGCIADNCFTKSVAKELGSRNIRCNAIAPGFIETDMTSYLKDGNSAEKYLSDIPLGRFGKAEDIANVTLFLASDMGNYLTGQVISACGGLNI